MVWNYRVIRRDWNDFNDSFYAIYEVYYDAFGNIESIIEETESASGYSIEEAKMELELQARAFDLPVLEYEEVKDKFISDEPF